MTLNTLHPLLNRMSPNTPHPPPPQNAPQPQRSPHLHRMTLNTPHPQPPQNDPQHTSSPTSTECTPTHLITNLHRMILNTPQPPPPQNDPQHTSSPTSTEYTPNTPHPQSSQHAPQPQLSRTTLDKPSTNLIEETERHNEHGHQKVGDGQGQHQVVGHALKAALHHDGGDDEDVAQHGGHDHAAQ